jgi:hypothetical protein
VHASLLVLGLGATALLSFKKKTDFIQKKRKQIASL